MIKLRDATVNDMPRILELAIAMHEESRLNVLELNFGKIEALFTWIIESDDGFFKVIERHDNIILGGFAGFVAPHWTSDDYTANDCGLFIDKEFRGFGNAVRLIKEFRSWAESRGAKMITCAVNTGVTVEGTRKLFEHCGFETVGYLFEGKQCAQE